jgi:transposase
MMLSIAIPTVNLGRDHLTRVLPRAILLLVITAVPGEPLFKGRLVVHHSDDDAQSFLWYADTKTGGTHGQKYLVSLTEDERATVLTLTKKGTVAARTLTRAHILLHADGQATDDDIAQALHIGTATVERIRKRFVEEGLEAALSERPRLGGRRTLEGKPEALLVARACSTPPDEWPRWTMQFLADKLVELKQVESIEENRAHLGMETTQRGSA